MEYEKAYNDLIARINAVKKKPKIGIKGKHHYDGYVESGIRDALDYILNPESEDERIRKWLIEMVEELRKANPTNAEHNGNCSEAIAYLERQEEYIDDIRQYAYNKGLVDAKQQPAEWSEEDENRFRNLIYLVEHSNEGKGTKEGFVKFINRLKSLRPQPSPQLSTNHTVWHNASEEKPTKLPIIHIWYHGNRVNAVTHEDTCLQAELDDINFQPDDKWAYVEDLLNVQPHWKPSEEQMEALYILGQCVVSPELKTLFFELKKLM